SRGRCVGYARFPAIRIDARAISRHRSQLARGREERQELPRIRNAAICRTCRRGTRRRPKCPRTFRSPPQLLGAGKALRNYRRRRPPTGLGCVRTGFFRPSRGTGGIDPEGLRIATRVAETAHHEDRALSRKLGWCHQAPPGVNTEVPGAWWVPGTWCLVRL